MLRRLALPAAFAAVAAISVAATAGVMAWEPWAGDSAPAVVAPTADPTPLPLRTSDDEEAWLCVDVYGAIDPHMWAIPPKPGDLAIPDKVRALIEKYCE